MKHGPATGESQPVGISAALAGFAQELREISLDGPRSRQCTFAASSVALSVAIALVLHMDEVWWAAISGFMSSQATRPGSIQRGILRIAGTAGGAALALLAAPFTLNDHVTCDLFLLMTAWIGMYGMLSSRHGYAWLFCGVTAIMVTLLAIVDPPSMFRFAFFRTAEVAIGCASAVFFALIFSPDGPPDEAAPRPGWSNVLGLGWPAALHALRCGVAVVLLPTIWSQIELPGVVQMAVSVAAVMAVPARSDDALTDGRRIAGHALHRLIGCFLGGAAGLLLLALPLTQFLPWLITLAAGVWIGTHIQSSTRGVGYIGTQATVVYVVTLVQGWGPPSSILPGIDRFIGILCGVTILLLASLSWLPGKTPAPARATAR
jgi:uncharacterized membrane protein YccC